MANRLDRVNTHRADPTGPFGSDVIDALPALDRRRRCTVHRLATDSTRAQTTYAPVLRRPRSTHYLLPRRLEAATQLSGCFGAALHHWVHGRIGARAPHRPTYGLVEACRLLVPSVLLDRRPSSRGPSASVGAAAASSDIHLGGLRRRPRYLIFHGDHGSGGSSPRASRLH